MKKLILCLLTIALFNCDDITEVDDISNENVTVLERADSSVLTIIDINFSWNAIEDAEQYRLQIATPDFETATQVVLDTTIVNSNFTQTLELGSYQWRVRAENSEYQTAFTTQSFTVEE